MVKLTQVCLADWAPGDYRPVAMLFPGWKELSVRLGITFEDHEEDGLGMAKGRC